MSPSILIFNPPVWLSFAEMIDAKPFNLLQIKCEKNSGFNPEAENWSSYIPGECNSTIYDEMCQVSFKIYFSWDEHLNSKKKK